MHIVLHCYSFILLAYAGLVLMSARTEQCPLDHAERLFAHTLIGELPSEVTYCGGKYIQPLTHPTLTRIKDLHVVPYLGYLNDVQYYTYNNVYAAIVLMFVTYHFRYFT